MRKLSVVIPVFNEEPILEAALRLLNTRLERQGYDYEIILSENGSRDSTVAVARALATELPRLRLLHSSEPNYGKALRLGIEAADGDVIVCDEIDLGDVDFYARAIALLDAGTDLVVGSKRHQGSKDERPWIRRQGTAVINGLLRLTLDFKGTDTHGLKAFRKDRVMPVVASCVVEHDLFASELVIRAERAGLDVREIPLELREIRPPSVALMRRVPRVLKNLARLVYVIRIRG